MAAKMELGSLAEARRRQRDPRNWDADLEAARHVMDDGADGFAASSIRNAAISACRLVGLAMTRAKLSIFTIADGHDVDDGTPLIRIIGPPPEQSRMVARLPNGAPNICVRPLWRKWGAVLRIRYDADQFMPADIGNLIMRVGQQTGICEGRPDSKNSNGIGAGLFEVLSDDSELDELRALDPILQQKGSRRAA